MKCQSASSLLVTSQWIFCKKSKGKNSSTNTVQCLDVSSCFFDGHDLLDAFMQDQCLHVYFWCFCSFLSCTRSCIFCTVIRSAIEVLDAVYFHYLLTCLYTTGENACYGFPEFNIWYLEIVCFVQSTVKIIMGALEPFLKPLLKHSCFCCVNPHINKLLLVL